MKKERKKERKREREKAEEEQGHGKFLGRKDT